jgi:hypothetical protein
VEFSCNLNAVKMQKDQAMSFIGWFFVDLGEILCDDLILFRLVLIVGKLLSLAHQLDDIFQFHVFVDFLDIRCQGLHFNVVVAANYSQVCCRKGVFFCFLVILDAFYMA